MGMDMGMGTRTPGTSADRRTLCLSVCLSVCLYRGVVWSPPSIGRQFKQRRASMLSDPVTVLQISRATDGCRALEGGPLQVMPRAVTMMMAMAADIPITMEIPFEISCQGVPSTKL